MKNTERTALRKTEILDIAERLFLEKGYEKTTINDILIASGMAKGSLYYHFKSKEDVLDGIIERIAEQITLKAQAIANDPALTAHEKIFHIIASSDISGTSNEQVLEELHKSSNALLHQKSIVQTLHAIAPIMAGVVEQGIQEGIYSTQYPLESVEILLIAGQFIFDAGIFSWTPEEAQAKMLAFISITESVLGAAPGSFLFLIEGGSR